MSGCTLEWQVFPNNKGHIQVRIVDMFTTTYSICHGTKWDLVELAIVKTHSRFCLRYARYHNWQFYWYNLQSYASVRSSRHPSSLPSFLLQLPILSLTHIPHALIHPRSPLTHPTSQHIYPLIHSLTFPPHLLTQSLTDSLTHPLIHSPAHSLTHWFTRSLTQYWLLWGIRTSRCSKVEFSDSICAKALRPAGPVIVP